MLIARLRRRLIAIFRPRIQAAVLAFSTRVATDGGTYKDNGADERALWASMGVEPSLVLTPSAFKAAKLYALEPSDGSGDFTVDRASSATYVDENGVIQTAAANEPRIDHSSGEPVLLVEGQATNLIDYSQNFNLWTKTNVAVNNDVTASPAATLTADKITDNANYASHDVRKQISVNTGSYTFSFFVKSGSKNWVKIYNGISGAASFVDSNTGLKGTTDPLHDIKIKDFGNGWFRVSMTSDFIAGSYLFLIGIVEEDNGINYTGDGTGYIYLWGAQLEEASRASSYIPTAGTTVTRLGDITTRDGSIISNTKGVVFIDFESKISQVPRVVLNIGGTSSNNRIYAYFAAQSNDLFILTQQADGTKALDKIYTLADGRHKIAIRYEAGNHAVSVNGDLQKVSTSIVFDLFTTLDLGSNFTHSYYLRGGINCFKYFPKALPDADLIRLTK